MNKLFFYISLLFVSSSLKAQESNTNYFHDLSGFEDSTGVTQLFYRLYEPKNQKCSYTYNGESYSISINPYKNDIWHLNTETNSDSVSLRDYVQLTAFCEEAPYNIEAFIFLENDLSKSVAIHKSVYGLIGGVTLKTFDNNIFSIGIANPLGLNYQKSTNSLIVTSPSEEIVIKSLPDYEAILKKTFRFPLDQDSLWNEKGYYDNYPDSLLIDFSVLGISKSEESVFIGYKDSDLLISYDSGDTFEVLFNNFFDTHPINETYFRPLIFDPSDPTFYIRNQFNLCK